MVSRDCGQLPAPGGGGATHRREWRFATASASISHRNAGRGADRFDPMCPRRSRPSPSRGRVGRPVAGGDVRRDLDAQRLNNCRSTSFIAGLSWLPSGIVSFGGAGAGGIDGTGEVGAARLRPWLGRCAGGGWPNSALANSALPQSLLDQITQGLAEFAAERIVQSAAGRGPAPAAPPPACPLPLSPPNSPPSPPPSLPNRPWPISFSLA